MNEKALVALVKTVNVYLSLSSETLLDVQRQLVEVLIRFLSMQFINNTPLKVTFTAHGFSVS